jgi:hypothetical protein
MNCNEFRPWPQSAARKVGACRKSLQLVDQAPWFAPPIKENDYEIKMHDSHPL